MTAKRRADVASKLRVGLKSAASIGFALLCAAMLALAPTAAAETHSDCPAKTHQGQGELLLKQGLLGGATDAFEAARDAALAEGDLGAQAAAIDGLGLVAMSRGRRVSAERRHLEAADLFAQAGDRAGEARAMFNYALALMEGTGAGANAWLPVAKGGVLAPPLEPVLLGAGAERFVEAADIALAAGDTAFASRSLAFAARAKARSDAPAGSGDLALRAIEAALTLEAADARTDAIIAALDAGLFAALTDPSSSAKQAVSRAASSVAAAADASGDLVRQAGARGFMARAFGLDGRLDEALDLSRQAAYLAEEAGAPESAALWLGQAAAFAEAQGGVDEALALYARATQAVIDDRSGLSADVTAGRSGLRAEIAPILKARVDLLLRSAPNAEAPEIAGQVEEARSVIEIERAIEIETFTGDPCVRRGLSSNLSDLPADAAVLYPVVLEDRVEVLVGTNAGVVRRRSAARPSDLWASAASFRDSLRPQTMNDDYAVSGRALYDAIVAPVIESLKAQGVTTIVYAPEGGLREAPLAAFIAPDGRYLIQDFAVATTLSLSLLDPTRSQTRPLNALIGGVTESVAGYEPLPAVAGEVEAISSSIESTSLVDTSFTREALSDNLAAGELTIVHLATHGDFRGSARESFVLSHEGPIFLDELGQIARQARIRGAAIELLTLSACQTAAGDDRAVMGLAGAAFASGAQTVIGALWQVSDQSTASLFQAFYTDLRQSAEQGEPRDKALALAVAQRQAIAEGRHPFEWSAFVLLGKWL